MKTRYFAILVLCVLLGLSKEGVSASGEAFDANTLNELAVSGSWESLKGYIARHKAAIEPSHYWRAMSSALAGPPPDTLKRAGNIRLLLRSGADSDLHLPIGRSAPPEIVKIFLEEGAEVRPNNMPSPLYNAQLCKRYELPCYALEYTALLLEAGADPNAPPLHHPPDEPDTLLTRLIYRNAGKEDLSLPLIKMLLQAGADPNYGSTPDRTPLNLSVAWSRKDILVLLLEAGADPSLENPLANALRSGKEDMAEILLRHGASLKGAAGGKCLRAAAYGATPAMVRKLLDAGADPRLRNEKGATALDSALARRSLAGGLTADGEKISAMLREAGVPSLTERQQEFYAAAHEGSSEEFTAILLDKDTYPDKNVLDHALLRALQAANQRDRRQIVALLLEKGADKDPHRPLRENVPPEILQLFLDAGAELHPKKDPPPLIWIDWEKSNATALARTLLDAGADPNAAGSDAGLPVASMLAELTKSTPLALVTGPFMAAEERKHAPRPPLLYAAATGKPDALQLLLDKGAAVDARDAFGLDALAYALSAGKAENAAALLSRGAAPAEYALEMAVRFCPGTVRALLDNGANAKSDSGFRALRMAVREGTPETVELLIKAGADVQRRDEKGESLLELARDRKNFIFFSSSEGKAIVKLLRNAGL